MASKSVPFPENPSNGEIFTYEKTSWQWWGDWGKWFELSNIAKTVTPHSYNNTNISTSTVIPFPENPSSEDVFTYKGVTWIYHKDWNVWERFKS